MTDKQKISLLGFTFELTPISFDEVRSLDEVVHMVDNGTRQELWFGTADHTLSQGREWYGPARAHAVWDTKAEAWSEPEVYAGDGEVLIVAAWHGEEVGHAIFRAEEVAS
jgi:hypothetical protein